jgi:HAD superfamily hydrolase (TIGR01458 family)
MGLDLADENLSTPVSAAPCHVREPGLVPHLLNRPDLVPELVDLAGRNPDSVLMGDAGSGFTYESLNAALYVLIAGAPLLAMGMTRHFRDDGGLCLEMRPFVRALEYAADVQSTVLGEPSAAFYHAAVGSLGLRAPEVAMVGDGDEADIHGAQAAGLQAILLRTGKYRPRDERRFRNGRASVCDTIGGAADLVL